MSLMGMSAESLSRQVDAEVPEIYVVIAKNSIAGVDAGGIAELLGVGTAEVQEIQTEQVYRDIRLLLAAEYAKERVETDFSWDEIESQALAGLSQRVKFEKDTDTLLKIAAVANRAQRRTAVNKSNVLDPSAGGARVPITLTRRIVSRLNRDGSTEKEETQQISVLDGTAANPKFEDIDALLGVSRPQPIPQTMARTTHDDFGVDDIGWVS